MGGEDDKKPVGLYSAEPNPSIALLHANLGKEKAGSHHMIFSVGGKQNTTRVGIQNTALNFASSFEDKSLGNGQHFMGEWYAQAAFSGQGKADVEQTKVVIPSLGFKYNLNENLAVLASGSVNLGEKNSTRHFTAVTNPSIPQGDQTVVYPGLDPRSDPMRTRTYADTFKDGEDYNKHYYGGQNIPNFSGYYPQHPGTKVRESVGTFFGGMQASYAVIPEKLAISGIAGAQVDFYTGEGAKMHPVLGTSMTGQFGPENQFKVTAAITAIGVREHKAVSAANVAAVAVPAFRSASEAARQNIYHDLDDANYKAEFDRNPSSLFGTGTAFTNLQNPGLNEASNMSNAFEEAKTLGFNLKKSLQVAYQATEKLSLFLGVSHSGNKNAAMHVQGNVLPKDNPDFPGFKTQVDVNHLNLDKQNFEVQVGGALTFGGTKHDPQLNCPKPPKRFR